MALCKPCSELHIPRLQLLGNSRSNEWNDGDSDTDSVSGASNLVAGRNASKSVATSREQDYDFYSTKSLSKYNRTAQDIVQTRAVCVLCKLVAHHLEKQHADLGANVDFISRRFCTTADQRVEFEMKSIINRVIVRLLPETAQTLYGPPETHQMETFSANQPREILELHECCEPVPTTGKDSTLLDEGEQPNKTDFSSRLVEAQADFGLVRSWISLCATSHGERCSKSPWPIHNTRLDSLLLIDVHRMCVVEAAESSRYVALSYCWGTAPMLRHLLDNSSALMTDGSLANAMAPATIRDAITLVHAVGERYLWVDALCIVQDDPAIQQKQLAQMGSIYSLAAFTIVAAAGTDADAGLPGVRENTRTIDQEVIRIGDRVLVSVIDGDEYYGGVKNSKWITRGWTMQEKVLSKKSLIFTDQQVYWNCSSATYFEEVVLEGSTEHISFAHNPSQGGNRYRAALKLGSDPDHPLRDFTVLVISYMERELSYKADILNAFSGICQVMSSIDNEPFHWGLPVSHFHESLFWRLTSGGMRNHALSHVITQKSFSVPFPSWSWTAWHGSSEPWISWVALHPSFQGKGLHDPLLHPVGEPSVIIIYCVDRYGTLGRLDDLLHQADSPATRTVKPERSLASHRGWKGYTYHVEDLKLHQIDTGLLYFWTSVARLHVRRKGKEYMAPGAGQASRYTTLQIPAFEGPYIETTEHLPFQDSAYMASLPEDIRREVENDESCDVLALDFVVVGAKNGNPETLNPIVLTLVVEWKDDVAYRIGIASFREKDWDMLAEKAWRQITLG